MVTARGIRAGAAYIKLVVNDNALARGLKRAQKRLKAFGASIRQVGMSMVKMSAVLATPFIAGTKVFADFEQQMARIATMLNGKDMEFLPEFRKSVRAMMIEFGKGSEDITDALYDILSAHVPASKAMDMLSASLKAATAGSGSVKDATGAMLTLMETYGDTFHDAADASDFLFSIIQRGRTDLETLAPSIGMVISTAKAAGLSLEDMGASLALLTRATGQTDASITSLNAIAMTFLKPAKEGAKAWRDKFGSAMNYATLQTEGMTGVLQKLSTLNASEVAEIFPNKRAIRGILPALAKLEGFATDTAAMSNRTGATEVAYKKMTRTLMHSFNKLKQSAMVVLSVLGEAISQPVSRAVKAVTQYAQVMTDLIQKNKGLVIATAKVVAVIGLMGGMLVTTGLAASIMAFAFGGIASIITGIGMAIGLLGSALAALLSPIGAVSVGFATLAAYLLHTTGAGGKALAWLGEKFEYLKGRAQEAIKGISDALAAGDISLAAKVLWLSLKIEWQHGVNVLKEYWIGFKEIFISVATDAFYGAVKILAGAWNGMRALWVQTSTFMANVWTRFTSSFQSAWRTAQGYVEKGIHELWGLWDETYDVQTAKKMAEVATQSDVQRIQTEKQKALAESEVKHDEELARIGSDHLAQMQAIEDEAKSSHEERRKRYAAELQASQDALTQARQEWKDAIAEASQKRKAAEASDKGPGRLGQPVGLIDRIKQQLALAGTAIQKSSPLGVAGTFNAAAAQGLGAGGAAERTARATEETAKNTKKLVNEATLGGLTFS